MNDAEQSRLSRLLDLLGEEANKRSIYNHETYAPLNNYDEILPNCFLGNAEIALNKSELTALGITHVLNAAKGEKQSQVATSQAFYDDVNIRFMGCALMDVGSARIETYLAQAAAFISQAIDTNANADAEPRGRILIHCLVGVSRSASLLVAYLIKYKAMRLEDALRLCLAKRFIWPNSGFLLKLMRFEAAVRSSTLK